MIKVTVLYPNAPGSQFDFDYYLKKHIPMTIEVLGQALTFVMVERGTAGPTPGSPPANIAICHLYFESMQSFLGAFMPVAMKIQGDIINYTDIEAVIQFSEEVFKK